MKRILVASIAAFAISSVPAHASVVATFADPSGSSGLPLFSWDSGTAATGDETLDGGWTGTGLNLSILGTTYQDATFTMTQLSATSIGQSGPFWNAQLAKTGGGTANVTFYDSGHNAILGIDFSRAYTGFMNLGNEDLFVDANDVVNIYGLPPGPDIFLDPETFQFSFANRSPGGTFNPTTTDYTWTASFTSSATVVPEPTSMLLLGTGLLGAAAAARRRMKKRQ